jgi:hypothetical protein
MRDDEHRVEAPVFRVAFARMDLVGAEDMLRSSLRRELDAWSRVRITAGSLRATRSSAGR